MVNKRAAVVSSTAAFGAWLLALSDGRAWAVIGAGALLVAAGWFGGRWPWVLAGLVVVPAALLGDQFDRWGWAAFDRSEEREPIPFTVLLVFFVPLSLVFPCLGLLARWLATRLGHRPAPAA